MTSYSKKHYHKKINGLIVPFYGSICRDINACYQQSVNNNINKVQDCILKIAFYCCPADTFSCQYITSDPPVIFSMFKLQIESNDIECQLTEFIGIPFISPSISRDLREIFKRKSGLSLYDL